jgi:hypothetical protein
VFPATPAAKAKVGGYATSERAAHDASTRTEREILFNRLYLAAVGSHRDPLTISVRLSLRLAASPRAVQPGVLGAARRPRCCPASSVLPAPDRVRFAGSASFDRRSAGHGGGVTAARATATPHPCAVIELRAELSCGRPGSARRFLRSSGRTAPGLPDLRASADDPPVMGVELLLLGRQQLPTHEMILEVAASRACRSCRFCPLCVWEDPVRERMEVKLVRRGRVLLGDGEQVSLRPRVECVNCGSRRRGRQRAGEATFRPRQLRPMPKPGSVIIRRIGPDGP